MPHAILSIRNIRTLSLDIVLGACISSLFFAHLLKIFIPPITICLLGTSVWLIYTIDHLIDARKIKTPAHTDRHVFHQKYYKILLIITLIFIFSNLIILFFIPLEVIRGGIFLAATVFFYFIFMKIFPKSFTYVKELFAAFLYTSGVCLPALSLYHHQLSASFVFITFQFFLLVFMNLLSFSYTDYKIDLWEKHASLAVSIGRKSLLYLMRGVIGVFIFSYVMEYLYFEGSILKIENFVLFLMSIPFIAAAAFPKIMDRAGTFRAIGDSVFFIPFFALIFC